MLPHDAVIADRADLPRISAVTGEGVAELIAALDATLAARFMQTLTLQVPLHDTQTLQWMYANGKVTEHTQDEVYHHITVQFTNENAARALADGIARKRVARRISVK